MHKSDTVALVLCGVGVACIAGTVALVSCSDTEDGRAEAPPPQYVSSSTSYSNNHYLPYVGWFHAGTRTFEPYPHNTYVAGRGYYWEGGWHAAPSSSSTVSFATPTEASAQKANAAAGAGYASAGGSGKGSYSKSSGSSSSSSGSGGEPGASSRGGFGASGGHGSSGGSSGGHGGGSSGGS